MKLLISLVLPLSFGLMGCVSSNMADTNREAVKTADAHMSYKIGPADRLMVIFQIPSKYQPLPEGPIIDSYFRSFASNKGSTIDVYLESVKLKKACQVKPCSVVQHSSWQKASPTEQIYPKGVFVSSEKFERRDIFANLPLHKGRPDFSLKFVVKCFEGESCTDARESILRTVEIIEK